MTETRGHLGEVLPLDLVSIVMKYFGTSKRPQRMAENGQYEDCISLCNEKPCSWDNAKNLMFGGACHAGYEKLAQDLIMHGADSWDKGAYQACIGGRLEMLRILEGYGDWVHRATGAIGDIASWRPASGPHPICSRLHADRDHEDDEAREYRTEYFIGACLGGNLELAKLMYNRDEEDIHGDEYAKAMYAACSRGHNAIAKMIANSVHRTYEHRNRSYGYGYDNYSRVVNEGLCGACAGGHPNLAMVMLKLGSDAHDRGMVAACRGGFAKLAKLMIETAHGMQIGKKSYDEGLVAACEAGQRKAASLMLARGATKIKEGLFAACKNGCHAVADMLLARRPDLSASEWRRYYKYACRCHRYRRCSSKIIELLKRYGGDHIIENEVDICSGSDPERNEETEWDEVSEGDEERADDSEEEINCGVVYESDGEHRWSTHNWTKNEADFEESVSERLYWGHGDDSEEEGDAEGDDDEGDGDGDDEGDDDEGDGKGDNNEEACAPPCIIKTGTSVSFSSSDIDTLEAELLT